MKKNIVIGVFLALPLLFVLAYHNDVFYGKLKKFPAPLNPYLVNSIDNVINEFNVIRLIKQKETSDNDFIDLVLSSDDLKHISNSMGLFIDEGYIRDQSNPWRKAKVIVNGKKEKIKYKFHGTSVTPLKSDVSFLFGLIMRKLGLTDSLSIPPINSGVFSLKIKHKKESNYYNLMRRYKLISHHDDAEISTIVINKIASKLGLIAPHGRMVILRVNGAEIGTYMLVEAHNKEWFEREHQLTNYTIFKSNDDWDRKNGHPHASETDLYIENKKINTISQHSSVALGSLEVLLKAIKGDNIDQIKKMIDMDYMAKYMALLTITNNNHPISGDNLRYVYNHATGRFKLLFRLEDTILENNQTITDFNHSLFISPYENFETLKLFKLLLTDSNFLTKRDKELYKIIQQNKNWIELIDKTYFSNMELFLKSNEAIRPVKFKMEQFKKNFKNNIEKAKRYIDYNKIFITKYIDVKGEQSLHIVNDFIHPVILKNTSKINGNILIKPSKIDINQKTVYKEQEIDEKIDNINQLKFENIITKNMIPIRNIYFNEAIERPIFSKSKSLQTLKDNFVSYQVSHNNKVIVIQSGEYQINSNITTPYGFRVVIQAGTKFLFGKGVSFLVRGDLDVKGTSVKPVVVSRSQSKTSPFGVFAVSGMGVENTKVNINYLKFDGGSEAIVNGILFTGQMSINDADVTIKNSTFKNSLSDDGINIKYSRVDIRNSKFIDNFSDQIDLDYCQATIFNNVFIYKKSNKKGVLIDTDGLDISGSKVQATGNIFSNFSDKGISIGEGSNIMISGNEFKHNNLAIAIKDDSKAFIGKNQFYDNNIDISMYIKKKIYNNPNLYTIFKNKELNLKIESGDVFYMEDLQSIFQGVK